MEGVGREGGEGGREVHVGVGGSERETTNDMSTLLEIYFQYNRQV